MYALPMALPMATVTAFEPLVRRAYDVAESAVDGPTRGLALDVLQFAALGNHDSIDGYLFAMSDSVSVAARDMAAELMLLAPGAGTYARRVQVGA